MPTTEAMSRAMSPTPTFRRSSLRLYGDSLTSSFFFQLRAPPNNNLYGLRNPVEATSVNPLWGARSYAGASPFATAYVDDGARLQTSSFQPVNTHGKYGTPQHSVDRGGLGSIGPLAAACSGWTSGRSTDSLVEVEGPSANGETRYSRCYLTGRTSSSPSSTTCWRLTKTNGIPHREGCCQLRRIVMVRRRNIFCLVDFSLSVWRLPALISKPKLTTVAGSVDAVSVVRAQTMGLSGLRPRRTDGVLL